MLNPSLRNIKFVKLEEPEKTEVVKRYRETGEGSRVLIESHMPMAFQLINRYWCRYYKYVQDDEIVSVAFDSLVRAVERFRYNATDNNISTYIYTNIMLDLKRYRWDRSLIKTHPTKELRVFDTHLVEVVGNEERVVEVIDTLESKDDRSGQLEFEEFVQVLFPRDIDRQIVWLLIEGTSHRDIAKTLMIPIKASAARIAMVVERLRRYYREVNNED